MLGVSTSGYYYWLEHPIGLRERKEQELLFHIDKIFFSVAGYDVSYLEFVGLIFGLVAIALSSVANVWSWPLGIVNVILSFFLFYQRKKMLKLS